MTHAPTSAVRVLLPLAFMLAACGRAATGAAPAQSPSTPPSAAAKTEAAHLLVIAAASCWFGGSWSDALGEQGDAKGKGVEARCHDVERRVWGGAEDTVHYEQLRALEMNAVADVIAKVDETAKSDGVDELRRARLLRLTKALADAQKELMLARRAGERVKRDLDHEPVKLNDDEVAAVPALRAHANLQAMLSLDVGELSREAHAMGLLCALDHMEIARGLPKHLKVYAVEDPFKIVFGVEALDVPQDATKKLVPGTWLKFIMDSAAAAGHPVPNSAKTPREKDALAWSGVLRGFSDKLKVDADAIPATTELNRVVTVAIHRLETEYSAQQYAEATVRTNRP
jgi:hypothetical protein